MLSFIITHGVTYVYSYRKWRSINYIGFNLQVTFIKYSK